MGYLFPTRPEIKNQADGGNLSEVTSLRKEISTIGLHILLLGNNITLIFKLIRNKGYRVYTKYFYFKNAKLKFAAVCEII